MSKSIQNSKLEPIRYGILRIRYILGNNAETGDHRPRKPNAQRRDNRSPLALQLCAVCTPTQDSNSLPPTR